MATVLVVDDEPEIRALLRLILEREQYRVLEAGNGADALALCKSDMPDLVITDLLMPKMSGTDFLEALLDQDIKSHVIAMSGGSLGGTPHSEASKAQDLGIDGLIGKPFDPADVVKLCSSVLSSS